MNKILALGCAAFLCLAMFGTSFLRADGPCCAPPAPCGELAVTFDLIKKVKVPTCECTEIRLWNYSIKEIKGTKIVLKEVVKECVEDVCTVKQVPVTTCDPCTGCKKTEYKEEKSIEKVVHKTKELVPVKTPVTYRVLVIGEPEWIEVPKFKECEASRECVTLRVPIIPSCPTCGH